MKIILILVALMSIGCNKKADSKERNENTTLKDSINLNFSFVVSCGSGCALVYNLIQIKKENLVVKVEFDVTQYINEKVVDKYSELIKYVFADDEVYKIYIEENLVTEHTNGQLYLELEKLGNEVKR